jgi:hypothetical protein
MAKNYTQELPGVPTKVYHQMSRLPHAVIGASHDE